jgi:hypothetical protein
MASKDDETTDTLKIKVLPKGDGQYVCRLSRSPKVPAKLLASSSHKADISCDGQLPEHAIAIALEQLAAKYRRLAEEIQSIPTLSVEKNAEGKVIEKCFHVTVHFEGIFKGKSKFEVIHNTLMGSTVVESAWVTAIEIDPALHVAQAERWIDNDGDEE